MKPEQVIAIDWSAAGTPKTGSDSIWIVDHTGEASNPATRIAAEEILTGQIAMAVSTGTQTLIVMDVAFGAPTGLAATITGQASAPSLWDWIADRHRDDASNRTNYRDVAAELNRHFKGPGPFWGNVQKAETRDLPRKKPTHPAGLPLHRQTEIAGRADGFRPFPIWQLAGVGAVGAQSLTAMAMLSRLRHRFAGTFGIWPFDPPRPVMLAETYLSLQPAETARRVRDGLVKDAAQAGAMAEGFYRLGQSGTLPHLFAPNAAGSILSEEGWYLGAGAAELVQSAFDPSLAKAPSKPRSGPRQSRK